MIKRSQCMCACHKQSGVTHIAACCEPDEQTAQPSGSNEAKLLLTGMQAKKFKQLKAKGGIHTSTVVQVTMPDESICTIDDWGRCTWEVLC